MNPAFALLLLAATGRPAFVSGKVVLLDGSPVAGALVSSSRESDVTKPSGSWIVGRAGSGSDLPVDPDPSRGTLHVSGGRLRLGWEGASVDGRRTSGIPRERSASSPASGRALEAEPDTLRIFWKGKRLAMLPLTESDTGTLLVRVDTAWNHDFGVAWNARVDYGTLRDPRDGRIYRTIQAGGKPWMAENLALWASDIPECKASGEECTRFGLLFPSGGEIGGSSGTQACPSGWHVPTLQDWSSLAASLGAGLRDGSPSWGGLAKALKSSTGWYAGTGSDSRGFRAIPQYRDRTYFAVARDTLGNLAIQIDGSLDEVQVQRITPQSLWGQHQNIRCTAD